MGAESGSFVHEVSYTGKDGFRKASTVPVVQELVRFGLKQLPKRFNRVADEGQTPSLPCESFPVIDMAKLKPNSDPSLRRVELLRLAHAVKDWGMFFITGHDVPSQLMTSLSDAIKSFFSLSFEEKKNTVGSYLDADNLGYGRSFVDSDDHPLDWFDRWAARVQPNQDKLGLNLWPKNPTNFRPVMEDYTSIIRETFDQILQAMAESLGLSQNVLLKTFEPKDDCILNMRVNYYPPWPGEDASSSPFGLSPHTDGSAMTIIAQFDGVEGLEVLRTEGWVRVPAPKDMLLVGAGDLIEIISNGWVVNPRHRAATRDDMERYSVVLFYYPPENGEVRPMVEGGPNGVKYRNVVVGEYLKNYYKVSPTKEERIQISD